MEVLLLCLEGLVLLEINSKALDGTHSRDNRNDQADPTQNLEPSPCEGKFLHVGSLNVHLYGEVNRQWPEGE